MSQIIIEKAMNICSVDGYYGELETASDGTTRFIRYGRDIRIDKIFRTRDDGRYFVLLSFEKNEGDREEYFVERGKLDQAGFYNELISLGADIVPKYRKELQAHLQSQFELLKSTHGVHKKLGWYILNGELVFCSWRSTGKKSRFLGKWDVEPAGSFKKWRKMVKKDILPYNNLSVALLIGLSAPISALLADTYHTQNPIYSISGNSSSGKTTAGILAASTTFNPRPGSYDGQNFLDLPCNLTGGIMSWNATSNIVLTRLMSFNGVVAVIDELSKFDDNDMSSLVYSLSDGVEKARMSSNMNVRDTNTFRASILSIGEERLSDQCLKERDGLKVRILEIDGDMTVDADHSERIKSCCTQNYGHATFKLVKWILANGGKDIVLNSFEKWRNIFRALDLENHYADRRITLFMAPLMVTAELCKEALEIDFDLERLQQHLANMLQRDNEEIDIASKLYYQFSSFVGKNRSNFDPLTGTKCYGRIYRRSEIPRSKGTHLPDGLVFEVAIRQDELHAFLRTHGNADAGVILRTWKARGLLNCEEGKLYRKRKLDDVVEKLYVVRFFEELDYNEEIVPTVKARADVITQAKVNEVD